MTESVKLTPFDPADHLKNEEDMAAYLEAVLEEHPDDAGALLEALGVIARARNVAQLARSVDMTRAGLYRALSSDGNPSFANVAKICSALGLRLRVEADPRL